MDPAENSRAVAQELISLAQQQAVDLTPFCTDDFFQKDQRSIWFWRKDEVPGSGRADEPDGTLHYSMQGAIAVLPEAMKESASAFRGGWSESGTFENIEQAFELLKAWLLDRKEIDHLPQRQVRRAGIG